MKHIDMIAYNKSHKEDFCKFVVISFIKKTLQSKVCDVSFKSSECSYCLFLYSKVCNIRIVDTKAVTVLQCIKSMDISYKVIVI